MPDATHAAGVVALNIVERDGKPRFERRWEYPAFDSQAARARFRYHPSRLALVTVAGIELGVLVEAVTGQALSSGERGRLLALRTEDGSLAAETTLLGPGYRFSLPLVHGGRVYVGSCETENGPGTLEAYSVEPE
jgi:hypothetical protein